MNRDRNEPRRYAAWLCELNALDDGCPASDSVEHVVGHVANQKGRMCSSEPPPSSLPTWHRAVPVERTSSPPSGRLPEPQPKVRLSLYSLRCRSCQSSLSKDFYTDTRSEDTPTRKSKTFEHVPTDTLSSLCISVCCAGEVVASNHPQSPLISQHTDVKDMEFLSAFFYL